MPVRASGQTAFKIEGVENVERALKRVARATFDKMPNALYEAGESIMRQSKEIVPVDLGALKASGTVARPEVSGGTITVQMGYGGVAGPGFTESGADYAIIQHERTDLNHPGQGEPKYLLRPVNEARSSLARELGRKAKVVMRRAAR